MSNEVQKGQHACSRRKRHMHSRPRGVEPFAHGSRHFVLDWDLFLEESGTEALWSLVIFDSDTNKILRHLIVRESTGDTTVFLQCFYKSIAEGRLQHIANCVVPTEQGPE